MPKILCWTTRARPHESWLSVPCSCATRSYRVCLGLASRGLRQHAIKDIYTPLKLLLLPVSQAMIHLSGGITSNRIYDCARTMVYNSTGIKDNEILSRPRATRRCYAGLQVDESSHGTKTGKLPRFSLSSPSLPRSHSRQAVLVEPAKLQSFSATQPRRPSDFHWS
jgi:hypothetical protein